MTPAAKRTRTSLCPWSVCRTNGRAFADQVNGKICATDIMMMMMIIFFLSKSCPSPFRVPTSRFETRSPPLALPGFSSRAPRLEGGRGSLISRTHGTSSKHAKWSPGAGGHSATHKPGSASRVCQNETTQKSTADPCLERPYPYRFCLFILLLCFRGRAWLPCPCLALPARASKGKTPKKKKATSGLWTRTDERRSEMTKEVPHQPKKSADASFFPSGSI